MKQLFIISKQSVRNDFWKLQTIGTSASSVMRREKEKVSRFFDSAFFNDITYDTSTHSEQKKKERRKLDLPTERQPKKIVPPHSIPVRKEGLDLLSGYRASRTNSSKFTSYWESLSSPSQCSLLFSISLVSRILLNTPNFEPHWK